VSAIIESHEEVMKRSYRKKETMSIDKRQRDEHWSNLAQQLRVDSIRSSTAAGSGHPTPTLPWVDVATGSLGQGMPLGVGIALAGKYLEKPLNRVWVLMGDSEMAEGSAWEAFDHASHYQLDNLVAILDCNRLGMLVKTLHGWDCETYAEPGDTKKRIFPRKSRSSLNVTHVSGGPAHVYLSRRTAAGSHRHTLS